MNSFPVVGQRVRQSKGPGTIATIVRIVDPDTVEIQYTSEGLVRRALVSTWRLTEVVD